MARAASDAELLASAERARSASGELLETLLYHRSRGVLDALLENPRLGERHLLILLARKDLSREIVGKIAGNREWMSSYPMKLAIVRHPRTPRHVARPLLKFIYLFDLMSLVLVSGVPAELKRQAEDAVLAQKEGLALGQRISLARRGSLRVAAGLLIDRERRVIEAALSNPALTEQSVAATLLAKQAPPELTEAVLNHPRWFVRRSVKLALVRNLHLTLARLLQILPQLSEAELADLVPDRRVADNIRAYAYRTIQGRRQRRRSEL